MSDQSPDPLWKLFGVDTRYAAPELLAARRTEIETDLRQLRERAAAFEDFEQLVAALRFVDSMRNPESELPDSARADLVTRWIERVRQRLEGNIIPF